VVDRSTWSPQPVFDLIARTGPVSGAEMEHAFNLGVGMVAVIAASDEEAALRLMRERGVAAWRLGEVHDGSGTVRLTGEYAGTYRA
jgi:phosphoribosylformylglycinamidine cyclo-ligase